MVSVLCLLLEEVYKTERRFFFLSNSEDLLVFYVWGEGVLGSIAKDGILNDKSKKKKSPL